MDGAGIVWVNEIRRMIVDAQGQRAGTWATKKTHAWAGALIPGTAMPKLSEYVEMAANEYLQETGKDELDARWIAGFFQDSGVLDDYPRQDLVAFSAMVQKELTKHPSGPANKPASIWTRSVGRNKRSALRRMISLPGRSLG